MAKPRLCVDIDNVVAQTDEVMRRVIREFTGGRVDFAYPDICVFEYWKCKDARGESITREQWEQIHDLFSEPPCLWQIQPVPGVQSRLAELSGKWSLHLVTSRLAKARRTTVEWLECHHFPSHCLHFVLHGEKHIVLGRFGAAVEDDRSQAESFAQAGTLCYLIAHPWNAIQRQTERIRRVADWQQVCADLNNEVVVP